MVSRAPLQGLYWRTLEMLTTRTWWSTQLLLRLLRLLLELLPWLRALMMLQLQELLLEMLLEMMHLQLEMLLKMLRLELLLPLEMLLETLRLELPLFVEVSLLVEVLLARLELRWLALACGGRRDRIWASRRGRGGLWASLRRQWMTPPRLVGRWRSLR